MPSAKSHGRNFTKYLRSKNFDIKFYGLSFLQKTAGKSVYSIASAKVADAGDYKCMAVITPKPELKDEAKVSVEVLSKSSFVKHFCQVYAMIVIFGFVNEGDPTFRLPSAKSLLIMNCE